MSISYIDEPVNQRLSNASIALKTPGNETDAYNTFIISS
jgi:hypothetical protein